MTAYLTFVNGHPTYLKLVESTIRSVLQFSRHSIWVYLIDVQDDQLSHLPSNDRIKYIRLNNINLKTIYQYKPYIIDQALQNGLQKGFLLESDDVITPLCDQIFSTPLEGIPLSPIHPDNVVVPAEVLKRFDVTPTQHYIHAHIYFDAGCREFIKMWLDNCLEFDGYNHDETVLNCMYWRKNCHTHYLPVIDPYYKLFYSDERWLKQAMTFHGCKNPAEQEQLLIDLVNKFVPLRVISFCLWGHQAKYNIGAIENAKLAQKYYPDFVCWFYIHRPSVPEETIQELAGLANVRLIFRSGPIRPNRFMAWRFEPHDEPLVELFISRDTDTRILPRECLAVREWIESKMTLHIMRDSPSHYPKILGGMFGLRPIMNCNLTARANEYFSAQNDKDDQNFLADVVYPLCNNSMLIHDEIKKYEQTARPFPLKYDHQFNFVGQYVYEQGQREDWCTTALRDHVQAQLPNRLEGQMTIKTCLVACDGNSDYYGFFPLVSKFWKQFVNVETVLILVADEIPAGLKEFESNIILFKPIPNIPTAFQAQCIRLLFAGLLRVDGGVIISDMDLLPTNSSYYLQSIAAISEYKFVVYRDCLAEQQQYPICFCLARPEIWRLIFNVHSVADIYRTLKSWYRGNYKIGDPHSTGWATDQIKLYQIVQKWPELLVKLTDEQTGFRRLDRSELTNIIAEKRLYKQRLFEGYYSDFHLPRPVTKYKYLFMELFFQPYCLDRIVVIHYTPLIWRKKILDMLFKREGLLTTKIEWLTDYDREKITPEIIKQYYQPQEKILERTLSVPEIANAIAHIQTIRNCTGMTLIIEDDMIIKPNFMTLLLAVLGSVPNDWDIITLGGHYQDNRHLIDNSDNSVDIHQLRLVPAINSCTPTGCYLINERGCKKIMAHPLFCPIAAPFDETLCHILPAVQAKVYWVQPWLAYEGTKNGLYSSSIAGRGF